LPEQGATFVFELPLDVVIPAEGAQAPVGIADEDDSGG